MAVDWAKVLQERPDVVAAYNNESTRDTKSKTNLGNLGIVDPESFAKWWYSNKPTADTYVAPELQSVTPPAATTTTPASTVNAADVGPNRNTAYFQALNKARQAVAARGLNWEQYQADILPFYNNVFDSIPETDKNPSAYFDPNLAGDVLNGLQNKARMNYRSQLGGLSRPNLDYTALDATISKILGERVQETQDMLDRGQKRGQFNEAGINAGMNKLEQAKAKARAKLTNYASDLYSSKSSQFDDIYSRALSDANNYTLGDNFDIGRYNEEYDRLGKSITASLEGDLYSLADSEQLINPNDIRGAVGKGQGAINLEDLDVLDGLAKRKKASDVGRGLGSQGAF